MDDHWEHDSGNLMNPSDFSVKCPAPRMQAAASSGAVPTMEFRGVVVENGTVLRQWRRAFDGKGEGPVKIGTSPTKMVI
jgi:hypothetical protein